MRAVTVGRGWQKFIYAALAEAMHQIKMGNLKQVPIFMSDWCARRDKSGNWQI
jgi:hypothetical protein